MVSSGAKHSTQAQKKDLVLVGNANVGKSVVFSKLTGQYAIVSNYPGTTVEVTEGTSQIWGRTYRVIDTPGVNNLIPVSEDEEVMRNVLVDKKPDIVVQIGDIKNLRRTLLIAAQLSEMQVPVVLGLNMVDEAKIRGLKIDGKKLAKLIGIPIAEMIAINGVGFEELRRGIFSAGCAPSFIKYPSFIEEVMDSIAKLIDTREMPGRFMALMLLAGDNSMLEYLKGKFDSTIVSTIEDMINQAAKSALQPISTIISQCQQSQISAIIAEVLTRFPRVEIDTSEKLSALTMNPKTGIPIFIGLIYLVYLFVGVFGAGTLVNLLEKGLFGGIINPWLSRLLYTYIPIRFFNDFLVGQYGVFTMGVTYALAIVLPIIGTFFLAFCFLEDSGYIPRLAIMANKVFRKVGLNGKAVLPMVLGLGCVTMAILTTRVLETKKERIIATLLLALGIPCSAQLGVIFGLTSGLSVHAVLLVLAVVLSQIFLVGYLAARIIPGKETDFVLEIPPLRFPQWGNILRKTWYRVVWFLKEAIPLFILGAFIVFVCDKTGLLKLLIKISKPIVTNTLGLPGETTVAFLLGFIRRDYGAAGLYELARKGMLSPAQIAVSTAVISLFVPCIASFLVMVKERRLKNAMLISGFILPFAILIGAFLKLIIEILHISL